MGSHRNNSRLQREEVLLALLPHFSAQVFNTTLTLYIFLWRGGKFESEFVNRIDGDLFNVGVSKSITPLREYQYQSVCPTSSLAYFRLVIYCYFLRCFPRNQKYLDQNRALLVQPPTQFKQDFVLLFSL